MADEMQQGDEYQQLDSQNGMEQQEQEQEQQQSEEPMSENQQSAAGGVDEDEDEDDKKLFVGGLSWETTPKDLREYFEKYGEVTNCTLKTDLETKKSRGFGFVTFASADTVDKVLKGEEHKLHGRTIDPKRANPRPTNKKVFVGRLDPAIKEEDVRAYFETFGPVEKLELPFDKTKEQRRAFCFVEFKRSSAMKKCLETTNHKVGTQEVEVKKATPPGSSMMRGGPRGRGGFGPTRGRGGGFQGGYGYGGYGYNQGYGYGGGYDQGYGYGGYDQGYGGYGGGYNYGGGWNNGGYDQGYSGYGGYGDFY